MCHAKSVTCDNGAWTNKATAYPYQTCKKELPDNCVINTTKFYHDTYNTLYKKTTNKDGTLSCEAQERYCFDGVLSGNADFKRRTCSGSVVSGTTIAKTVNTAIPDTKPTLAPSKPTVGPVAPYTTNKAPNCAAPFGGGVWYPGQQGL